MVFSSASENQPASKTGRRAGFSLIEAAIVLGIMGVVLAAIWMTVGAVRENIRRDEATRQLTAVVNNIRAFYQGRVSIPTGIEGNFYRLTDDLCRAGVIPADMIRNRTVALMEADHPWGRTAWDGTSLARGGFSVCNNVNGVHCYDTVNGYIPDGQSFRIELRGLGRESCIAMAMRMTPQSGPPGLLGVVINNTLFNPASPPWTISSLPWPITVSAARQACGVGNNSKIGYIFRLRQQNP